MILATLVIDLDAMIFGMPTSLFPVLALDVFNAGPTGLGLLAAAPAVGALLGALLSGWVLERAAGRPRGDRGGRDLGRRDHAVRAVDVLVPARARSSWPIAGAADVLSAVFRSTIVQLETPDKLRGRVTLDPHPRRDERPADRRHRGGGVASVVGAQASVVSGRRLCLPGSSGSPGCSRSSAGTSTSRPRGRRAAVGPQLRVRLAPVLGREIRHVVGPPHRAVDGGATSVVRSRSPASPPTARLRATAPAIARVTVRSSATGG